MIASTTNAVPLTCFPLDESLSQYYRPITWTSKRTGTALSADVVAPFAGKPNFATFLHSNDRRKTLPLPEPRFLRYLYTVAHPAWHSKAARVCDKRASCDSSGRLILVDDRGLPETLSHADKDSNGENLKSSFSSKHGEETQVKRSPRVAEAGSRGTDRSLGNVDLSYPALW